MGIGKDRDVSLRRRDPVQVRWVCSQPAARRDGHPSITAARVGKAPGGVNGGAEQGNWLRHVGCPSPPRMLPFRRSEEHTSELQSLMRISYAVFCLKKKKHNKQLKG